MTPTIVISIVSLFILIIVIVYIRQFNQIKMTRNQIENAKSSLDALFIKRNELIPNLVVVVEKYTHYEKDVLEKITALRQSTLKETKDYQGPGQTDNLLKQLLLQVENYPELKANQQFSNLQYSINECEEQIAAGRRYLSSSITNYNNWIVTFPGNIVAGMSHLTIHEWERAAETQRGKVDVKNLFSD
jgi:LemA protein